MIYGSDLNLLHRLRSTVITKSLNLSNLPPTHFKTLELIYDLHNEGFSNKDISICLKLMGYKTKRTKRDFTQKDIWLVLKKYKERKNRKNQIQRIKLVEMVYLEDWV